MTGLNWTKGDRFLSGEAYTMRYPWSGAFDDSGYHVYSWKDGWAYSRPAHPILGRLEGCVSDLGEAKRICEDDFAKQARLHAWNDYMLSNDPPAKLP